jgi:hypothetical protein
MFKTAPAGDPRLRDADCHPARHRPRQAKDPPLGRQRSCDRIWSVRRGGPERRSAPARWVDGKRDGREWLPLFRTFLVLHRFFPRADNPDVLRADGRL